MSLSLFSLLLGKNHANYNRAVAHAIGLYEAIILFEILDKSDYFESLGQLESFGEHNDWFYLTIDCLEERTCIKRKGQDGAIKNLIEQGFIEMKVFGIPAKRYFRVVKEKIMDFFGFKKNVTRLSKTDKLDCPKRTNLPCTLGQTGLYIEKTKEKTRVKEYMSEPDIPPKVKRASAPVHSADASGLSLHLLSSIKKIKPDFKPPNLDKWARIIDLMIRIDNRTPNQIAKILDWLPGSEFWAKNILSAEKLRFQFDRLELDMETTLKPIKKKREESNYELVKKHFKHGEIYNGAECFINEESISFQRGMNHKTLKFKEFGFLDQFDSLLRGFQIKNTIKKEMKE